MIFLNLKLSSSLPLTIYFLIVDLVSQFCLGLNRLGKCPIFVAICSLVSSSVSITCHDGLEGLQSVLCTFGSPSGWAVKYL